MALCKDAGLQLQHCWEKEADRSFETVAIASFLSPALLDLAGKRCTPGATCTHIVQPLPHTGARDLVRLEVGQVRGWGW